MKTKFKAGKYYIGDLCYVIPHKPIDEWKKFCRLTIKGGECLNGEFPWKGGTLWKHGTAYGDGIYVDQDGHEYGVDAGLIGCIPLKLIDEQNETELKRLGNVVKFTKAFTCDYKDGVFTIGHIVIDTDPEDEDDEYCDVCGDTMDECEC